MYGQSGQYAHIGDVVKVAIKEARGEKVTAGTLKKAVVVETKFPTHRKNGRWVAASTDGCACKAYVVPAVSALC